MDLKELITLWESKGHLKRISQPVDADLEVTEILRRVFAVNGPALLFENVRGARMPLVTNIFGTWRRIWDIFGVDSEEALMSRIRPLLDIEPPKGLMDKARTLWKMKGVAANLPKEVGRAKCQEHVLMEGDINLGDIPVMKCWPEDAGRFITLPVVVTKDPERGIQNLGMYRMQIIDERTTGMHWHPGKGADIHYQKAKKMGKPLEAACVLGCEPAVIYSATAPLPPDINELIFAGMLMDKPVETVKCKTVDLMVPARSQIVLEGYVDGSETFPEGPFGDHTGYYTPQRPFPVFHITAVTTCPDPVYPSTAVGWPAFEDALLGTLTARVFLPFIKFLIPDIKDMALPVAGLFHNVVLASIDKRYPGQAYKVMDSIWGLGQLSTSKMVVIFDSDVDVHNEDDVLFHLGSSIDPLRDVVIKKGPLDILDHASLEEGFGGKMGIDATRKLPEEGHRRPWPARAVMDEETKRKIDTLWSQLGL